MFLSTGSSSETPLNIGAGRQMERGQCQIQNVHVYAQYSALKNSMTGTINKMLQGLVLFLYYRLIH